MLSLVTMLWRDPSQRWRQAYDYSLEHVKRIAAMAARNLTLPYRFVLATDDLHHDVDVIKVPLPGDLLTLGHRWAKLSLFRPCARQRFGARILYVDLDTVICSNIDSIVTQDAFRIMAATVDAPGMHYNSSLMLMDAGARPSVWDRFEPSRAEALCRSNGYSASDQFWIAQVLGRHEKVWTRDDGVYQFRDLMDKRPLPDNAKVVTFPGPFDPSMTELQSQFSWIKEHWRS